MLSVFECLRENNISMKKSKTNNFYTKSCHLKKEIMIYTKHNYTVSNLCDLSLSEFLF
jgi:hypothetical protein